MFLLLYWLSFWRSVHISPANSETCSCTALLLFIQVKHVMFLPHSFVHNLSDVSLHCNRTCACSGTLHLHKSSFCCHASLVTEKPWGTWAARSRDPIILCFCTAFTTTIQGLDKCQRFCSGVNNEFILGSCTLNVYLKVLEVEIIHRCSFLHIDNMALI